MKFTQPFGSRHIPTGITSDTYIETNNIIPTTIKLEAISRIGFKEILKHLTIMQGAFAAHTGGSPGKKANVAEWLKTQKIFKDIFEKASRINIRRFNTAEFI